MKNPLTFPNTPPQDCPLAVDKKIRFVFTGRHANYTNADTWFPSWASDGNLYSPWTDGYILRTDVFEPFDESHPGYACNSLDFMGRKAATAQAVIIGDNPLQLEIRNLPPRVEGDPMPYEGRYPCGSLVKDDIWYYGTYSLTRGEHCGGVGWTEMGPFVGFRISRDFGKTWEPCPHTPGKPLFGEDPAKQKVRIGSPHFVDFGQNMGHSRDGKAYLLASGSVRPDAWNNWIQADCIYLLRVPPTPETINVAAAYEFYAGVSETGEEKWTRDFEQMRPLIQWEQRLGRVTATWNPALGEFMMFVSRGIESTGGVEESLRRFDTMVMLAPNLTGPWRLAAYWERFGPIGYFVNAPSKFLSQGGRNFWLCYSANFDQKNHRGNPPGSQYSLSLHEVEMQNA